MRPRTFILIILVLVIGAAAVVLVVANLGGDSILPGGEVAEATEVPAVDVTEPGVPTPTATPSVSLEPVVVALIDLPIGERIREDLIEIDLRPSDNIALQGQYTFSELEEVVGQIARVPISKGQAILEPMVALNPLDLSSSGSDLALYIDRGKVAVSFPIEKFSGIAYSLRSGDLVDVMMTLRIVEIDPEFNTALPNVTQRVIETALLDGGAFLFPETTQGRLEFITDINQVVEFVPSDVSIEGQDFEPGSPIPRRVTQVTIQQAEVLWVGTWRDPREFEKSAEEEAAEAAFPTEGETGGEAAETAAEDVVAEDGTVAQPAATPVPERFENNPDVIILSMLTQDAMVLKWALERGIDIDLALRSQGDTTVYTTSSVSLPRIIDQGGLAIPEPADFDLHPRVDEVEIPSLPPNPPSN